MPSASPASMDFPVPGSIVSSEALPEKRRPPLAFSLQRPGRRRTLLAVAAQQAVEHVLVQCLARGQHLRGRIGQNR